MSARRVLAADDTAALRALLQLCLMRGGYEVDLAEDGLNAVDRFTTGRYAAVVLDVQMPVMDGVDAARHIRDWEKAQGRAPVPILVLTASIERGDLLRFAEAGINASMLKPFGREELLAALARELDAATVAAPPAKTPVEGEALDPDCADLIPGFLKNCRREAASMRSAIARGDFAVAARSTHKLIGSGATFGFQPLSDLGRLVETAVKRSDAPAALAQLDALDAYLTRASAVYPL